MLGVERGGARLRGVALDVVGHREKKRLKRRMMMMRVLGGAFLGCLRARDPRRAFYRAKDEARTLKRFKVRASPTTASAGALARARLAKKSAKAPWVYL